jgi:hypothetical protein
MKKPTLILAFLMATTIAEAQTIDSLPHHNIGPHLAQPGTIMQMRDGSVLGGFLLADAQGSSILPFGYVMHKVTRHGAEITDTLSWEWQDLPWGLTVPNPFSDNYILAEIANNNSLRIRHFDEDLNFDETNDTIIPLENNICGTEPGLLINPQNDLVVSYYDFYTHDSYFAQYGLDGTLKQKKTIDYTAMPFYYGTYHAPHYGLKIFNESPLQYCLWGSDENSTLHCYVLDSLFNMTKDYAIVNLEPALFHLHFDNMERVLGLNDGSFLLAVGFYKSNDETVKGVLVRKYDEELNLIKEVRFMGNPTLEYVYEDRPIGLEKGHDGCVYLSYVTPAYYNGRIVVVKMDQDLNVIWQRYCLESGYGRPFCQTTVLDDNGVAIIGNNYGLPEVFYLFVSDDYDALEEQGITIRPYTYYPNPAQDELHLQFSPDVTPTQIELYDLQGRLVRTQRNGLENLEMNGLPSGTYTMRVTLEGGKVFSDKVVKVSSLLEFH